MLLRLQNAAGPVLYVRQMIEGPHKQHIVEFPQPQRREVARVAHMCVSVYAELSEFLFGEGNIALAQVDERHIVALLRQIHAVSSRPAADI